MTPRQTWFWPWFFRLGVALIDSRNNPGSDPLRSGFTQRKTCIRAWDKPPSYSWQKIRHKRDTAAQSAPKRLGPYSAGEGQLCKPMGRWIFKVKPHVTWVLGFPLLTWLSSAGSQSAMKGLLMLQDAGALYGVHALTIMGTYCLRMMKWKETCGLVLAH